MEGTSPLKAIAEQVGVSKMTVSRALREGTSVGAELREKIREAARALGYQPDSRISQVMRTVRLAQRSSYRETLGFVWTHRFAGKEPRSSFFDEEFEGARNRAERLGYKLDEFRMTNESLNGVALSRILTSRGIRGVLISPPSFERAHPHIWLDWKQFSCVLIGQSFANAGVPRVQHDHYAGCVMAVRRLKRLRHKRIGLVLSRSMDERSARLIRSAFLGFHPLAPREAEKLLHTQDEYDPKLLKKWMQQARPEIILVNFENTFPRLEQIRRNAPPKTGLVALNWSTERPEIPGIDQHRSAIGEQAVDLLLLRLAGGQFGLDPLAPSIKVPGSWVDGDPRHGPSSSPKRKNRVAGSKAAPFPSN